MFMFSVDKDSVRQKFLDAGFNEVKMWYQAANWLFRDGKEFTEQFITRSSLEQDTEVMGECRRLFDTKYRQGNNTFELLVIMAYKD